MQKGSKPVNEDTTDGIVIRKETGENEINLSVYTKTELKQMYLDGNITRAE